MTKDRKLISASIASHVSTYYRKKGWATHKEVAVEPYGRRRADMIALNMKGGVIVCELKSCWADYSSDKKMHNYLPHCNFMYICATPEVAKRIKEHLKGRPELKNVGVMSVDIDKKWGTTVRVIKRTGPRNPVKGEIKRKIITRIAFRCGIDHRFVGGNL